MKGAVGGIEGREGGRAGVGEFGVNDSAAGTADKRQNLLLLLLLRPVVLLRHKHDDPATISRSSRCLCCYHQLLPLHSENLPSPVYLRGCLLPPAGSAPSCGTKRCSPCTPPGWVSTRG